MKIRTEITTTELTVEMLKMQIQWHNNSRIINLKFWLIYHIFKKNFKAKNKQLKNLKTINTLKYTIIYVQSYNLRSYYCLKYTQR